MVPTVMMIGIFTAFFVCLALPVGAAVYCHKHKGNAGGTIFVVVLGIAAAILSQNIASFLAGILQLNAVADFSYLLSLAIYAVIIAGVDLGIRMYTTSYMNKTGIGMQRGIAMSAGYIIGQCLSPVITLFTHVLYVLAIDKGTFLDSIAPEGYEDALAFQESIINGPASAYYVYAMEYIAIAVVHVLLTMLLIRGFLENKKGKMAGIAVGIRLAYELARQLSMGMVAEEGGAVYPESTALIISMVISVITILGGIYALKVVLTDFPKGKEPVIPNRKQQAAEAEERRQRLAWQEVTRLNTRNINRETPAVSEKTEEPEKAEESEKTEESVESEEDK